MADELNIITSDVNSVSVTTEDRLVVITNDSDITNITIPQAEITTVQISSIGPQGPKGIDGQPGRDGLYYVDTGSFVATSSFNNWTGSIATTGSNTFTGLQFISGTYGTLNYGSNDTDAYVTLADIHATNDTPWLERFYNDSFSTSNAVMAYFAWNDGRFIFHNESTQSIGLQVNGYAAQNGLLVYEDKVAFVNNIEVAGGITGSLYNKTFTKNNTSAKGINTILSKENVFNHGNLLIETDDTLIIEEGAEYFILGDLTNSGSIIVSGSLIVHGAIYNSGSILGPGPVLSNTTIVTYDKANVPYGFAQLDVNGNLNADIIATNALTASYYIGSGSFATTGSNVFKGNQIITGSLNATNGITGSLYNKPFLKNQTTKNSVNTIVSYENIFNHGNLLINSDNTLIIEEGASYFVLGDLTNSGSIIVSGSLTVNGAIHNAGNIIGPGPVLSNSTIVTYDKANVPYGFAQLDANGTLTGIELDPKFTAKSGSLATTGSNRFTGKQTVTGSLNVTSGITGSLYNEAFSKNRTTSGSINIIKQYQSIFNHSNLFIQENHIFIVEQNAEYYVLGDVVNSGSILVDGTFKIGGALLNNGNITGIGIIE
jgi:cephalosporin hydroxylase